MYHVILQIDLLYQRTIQGLLTQGHRTTGEMATTFTLQYGLQENQMIHYEEYSGVLKVMKYCSA